MATEDSDCCSIDAIETSCDEEGGLSMMAMELSLRSDDFEGGDDSVEGVLDVSGDLFAVAAVLPSDSDDDASSDACNAEGMLDESGDLFVMAADLPCESSQEGGY